MAIRSPAKIACGSVPTCHRQAAAIRNVVPAICGSPMLAMSGNMESSREMDISSPTVNKRTTTPISARSSTLSKSSTRDRPYGPTTTPETSRPMTLGICARPNRKTTTAVTAKTTRRSERNIIQIGEEGSRGNFIQNKNYRKITKSLYTST